MVFAILVHRQTSIANRASVWQKFRGFGITRVNGYEALTMIFGLDGVVDVFDIVTLVGDKIAIIKREKSISVSQDIQRDSAIGDIRGGCKLVKGQSADTIDQYMALVAPEELEVFLVILVGRGVNTQTAVGIGLRRVILAELIRSKGFGVIVRRIGVDGRGVKSNKGSVQYAQFIKSGDLSLHKLFKQIVVEIAQEAVIRPVGR